MAGPRIIKSMGEDLSLLGFLSRTNKHNVPYAAVIAQSVITIVLIVSAKFEEVLTFVGFSLSIFTFLTVFSVFILRARKLSSSAYKTWGYPVTPIIFLALNGYVLYKVFEGKPKESMYGLLNVAIGGIIYVTGKLIVEQKQKQKCQQN